MVTAGGGPFMVLLVNAQVPQARVGSSIYPYPDARRHGIATMKAGEALPVPHVLRRTASIAVDSHPSRRQRGRTRPGNHGGDHTQDASNEAQDKEANPVSVLVYRKLGSDEGANEAVQQTYGHPSAAHDS